MWSSFEEWTVLLFQTRAHLSSAFDQFGPEDGTLIKSLIQPTNPRLHLLICSPMQLPRFRTCKHTAAESPERLWVLVCLCCCGGTGNSKKDRLSHSRCSLTSMIHPFTHRLFYLHQLQSHFQDLYLALGWLNCSI